MLRRFGLYAAVTLVLLLAALVRIVHIGDQALWIDEGATYSIIRLPDLGAMVNALANRDHHPPLYFALLKAWTGVAGDSVVALRLFSALASILSVAAVFALARALNRLPGRAWFGGAGVGVLAMLFLTLSDPEFVLAQDTRMYALRTLLAILSMTAYAVWLRTQSRRAAALWVACGVLLFHTQYQGLYIAAVQGVHALVFLRGRARIHAIGLLAVQGLLFAPWFVWAGLNQRDNDPGIWAALPSSLETVRVLRDKFLGQMWPLTAMLLGLGTFALAAHGGRWRVRFRPWSVTFLLVVWVAFTLIVTFALNLFFPVLAPHRILLISPALAILMAQGMRNLPGIGRPLVAAVVVVYGVSTVDDYYPKESWDAVAASFAPLAAADDLVLLEVYRGDYPLEYYLDRTLPPGTVSESLRVWREGLAGPYPQGILERLAAHDSAWLVHWSPDESAFRFLGETGYTRTAAFATDHWGNLIHAYRYDRLDPAAPPLAAFTSGMLLTRAHVDRSAHGAVVHAWWQADGRLAVDYSVSAFILNAAGQLVAQSDGFPQRGGRPTTTWEPGETVYDPHPIAFTHEPGETYTVGVQVYTYFDGARFPLADGVGDYAVIATLAP